MFCDYGENVSATKITVIYAKKITTTDDSLSVVMPYSDTVRIANGDTAIVPSVFNNTTFIWVNRGDTLTYNCSMANDKVYLVKGSIVRIVYPML